MSTKDQILLALPLLVVPLAFSVALGGGERGSRIAPVAAPSASTVSVAVRAPSAMPAAVGTAPAPLRLARKGEHAAPRLVEPPRPVEPPREARSESLSRSSQVPSDRDERATEYSPVFDPTHVEVTALAATSAATLDDYGASPE